MKIRNNVIHITDTILEEYKRYLLDEERSQATVEKYIRDVRKFASYLKEAGYVNQPVNKDMIREYKEYLKEQYKIVSANSMLAAINSFFTYAGHEELKVKLFKVQRAFYSQPEKEITHEDYRELIQAARRDGDVRMSMLLQTMGSTGIRISELKFISVESLENGRAEIYNKGKSRVVIIPKKLADVLKNYCRKAGILAGSIFITRNGNPMDRSNIRKRMKQLGREAGVDTAKVFPHNLRHLFARTFYRLEKDVVRLMDLLGHSSINTTRIYTMETEEEPRQQLGQMNLVFG